MMLGWGGPKSNDSDIMRSGHTHTREEPVKMEAGVGLWHKLRSTEAGQQCPGTGRARRKLPRASLRSGAADTGC